MQNKLSWLCLGLAVLSTGLQAKWQIRPAISGNGVFTDNVNLSPSELKHSEQILEIAPQVTVDKDGRYHKWHAYYRLQGLLYRHGLRDHRIYHQALAQSDHQFWEQKGRLQFLGSYSQELVEPEQGFVSDNLTGARRSNVGSFSISPGFTLGLGPYMQIDGDFRHGQVHYPQDNQPTARDNQVFLSAITQGTSKLSTRFSFQLRDTDRGALGTTQVQNIDGNLSYAFTRQLLGYFVGGFEKNRGAVANLSEDGLTWQLGFQWQVNPRLSMGASAGHRPIGSTYSGQLDYQVKQLALGFEYSEEVTNSASAYLDNLPRADVNQGLQRSTLFVPQTLSDLFLQKRFDGHIEWQEPRGYIHLQAFTENREVLGFDVTEKGQGLQAELVRDINRKLNAQLSAGWATQRLTTHRKDRRWSIQFILTQTLSQSLTLNLQLSHLNNHSDQDDLSFRENLISLGVGYNA